MIHLLQVAPDPNIISEVLPRLLAELNTSSLVLLVVAFILSASLIRLNNRYIDHLESDIQDLKRDKYVLTNGSSVGFVASSPVSSPKAGGTPS